MQRQGVEKLCSELLIFTLSAEIHGGARGLYDLGPHGSAIQENIKNEWRKHFIHEEEMLEVTSALLTPHNVLKASGHVDRFFDYMVKDKTTGECLRADKLLEAHIDKLLDENKEMGEEEVKQHKINRNKADGCDADELSKLVKHYGITNNGNELSEPFEFKLMFKTQFGPASGSVAYLRPETAQGIFTNFKKLYDYNMGKMPFAAAQIGHAFRNEISPRNGLIRLREFFQMEVEHFFNGDSPDHPKFNEVANLQCLFWSADAQAQAEPSKKMTMKEAVSSGMVCNQTLGYFLARTWTFLLRIGIHESGLRFRQHMADEMAHYANDCWDAEIVIFGDWVECVGIADRGNYDLNAHIKMTNKNLYAQETYDKPREIERMVVKPNFGAINKKLKAEGFSKPTFGAVNAYFKSMQKEPDACQQTVIKKLQEGKEVTIERADLPGAKEDFTMTPDMVTAKKVKQKISVNKYVPSVVEPSFGLSRILYALMAHSFGGRSDDVNKVVLKLLPRIAVNSVAVLPLSNNADLVEMSSRLHRTLRTKGVRSCTDASSAAIGRRYVRMDKQGVPFALTIDFESLKDGSVTLRDRDTCEQVRLPQEADIPSLLADLSTMNKRWSDVTKEYKVVHAAQEGA